MMVKMLMLFFWVVMLCELVGRYVPTFQSNILPPSSALKIEAVMFLCNIGIYLQIHMALLPTRLTLT
jgi:hypothetical protein